MITSLSWLKNHLATNANVNQVIERLTKIGLEVENIKSSNDNLDNLSITKAELIHTNIPVIISQNQWTHPAILAVFIKITKGKNT